MRGFTVACFVAASGQFIGAEEGVFRARTWRRLPEKDGCNNGHIDKIVGALWVPELCAQAWASPEITLRNAVGAR